MKKQILLLTVVVLSLTSMAQTKTSFGIRGGLTSSGLRGEAVNNLQNLLDFTDGAITPGNRTSFFGGGNVTISLNDIISIEPALYYAQKGYELKGELNIKGAEFIGANAKAQLTSHYIDLPVTLKANLGGFKIFAGPQISYLVKADLRTTAGVLGFNILDRKMDATEQLNRWDAGVTGGIGWNASSSFTTCFGTPICTSSELKTFFLRGSGGVEEIFPFSSIYAIISSRLFPFLPLALRSSIFSALSCRCFARFFSFSFLLKVS
jgi:hypothetical protein